MKKPLPDSFLENMKRLFAEFGKMDELDAFIRSFSMEPKRGIRINSLKVALGREAEEVLAQSVPGALTKVPWSNDGFYIPDESAPGKHPFYLAGLYYLQEPSAMLPAAVLDAKPGEHILDLCAAPGGKTVKIAADMRGEGILISNDINETRVKALVRNVELAGCVNCVVLNESPERLAQKLPGYFDKILLDAPCSGEGMFRRDPDAVASWKKYGGDTCVKMQREILTSADLLLKPGGILVYSTCTFSARENEEMIEGFLREHPDYTVLPIGPFQGVDTGLSKTETLRRTGRIFPYKADGEGHFCAKIQKGEAPSDVRGCGESFGGDRKMVRSTITKSRKRIESPSQPNMYAFSDEEFKKAFREFSQDVLTSECVDAVMDAADRHIHIIQGHVYTLPEPIPSLDGLKIAKKGLYLGDLKIAKRAQILFEPSHSFLLSRKRSELKRCLSFSAQDPTLLRYLKGETIFHPDIGTPDSGCEEASPSARFVAVCAEGYPVGWGKQMSGSMIKNLYPQGWRR